MSDKTLLILLPRLLCDLALWAHQIKSLSNMAEITIADFTRDDSIEVMAKFITNSNLVTTVDCCHLAMLGRQCAYSAVMKYWLTN